MTILIIELQTDGIIISKDDFTNQKFHLNYQIRDINYFSKCVKEDIEQSLQKLIELYNVDKIVCSFQNLKHKMGYKLLRDNNEHYLCLLTATGTVIANDLKYRTNEVFIYQIIRIHNLKKVKSVNHISFYDYTTKIRYNVNQYVLSNLNTSSEICAEGIHYFPITGSSADNFFKYFRKYNLNFKNINIILNSWISDQNMKKEN